MNTIQTFWKNKTLRNGSIIILVAIILLTFPRVFTPASPSESESDIQVQVISIELTETIEASGSLEAQPFANLTWKTNGIVEAVNVDV